MDGYNQYGSYGQGRPQSYGQSTQQPHSYGGPGGQQAAGQQASSTYGQNQSSYPAGYGTGGTSGGYTGSGSSYQPQHGSYGSGSGTGAPASTYGASGGSSAYGSGSGQYGAAGSNAATYGTGGSGAKYSSPAGAPTTYGGGTGSAPSTYQPQTNYSANAGGTYAAAPSSNSYPPNTTTGAFPPNAGGTGYSTGASTYGSGGYGTAGSNTAVGGGPGQRPAAPGAYGANTGPSTGTGTSTSSAAAGSSAGGPYGAYGGSSAGASQSVPALYGSSSAAGATTRPGGAAAQALAHMPADQQSKLVSMVQQQNAYGQTAGSGPGPQLTYGQQQQTQQPPAPQQQYGSYGQGTGTGSNAPVASAQQGNSSAYSGGAPRTYGAVPTAGNGSTSQAGGAYSAHPQAQTSGYGASTSGSQPPAGGYGSSSTPYGSNPTQPPAYGSTSQKSPYASTAAQPGPYGQTTGQQSAYGATASQQAATSVPGLGAAQPASTFGAGLSYGAGSTQQASGARPGAYGAAPQQAPPTSGLGGGVPSHSAPPGLHGGSGTSTAYAAARQPAPPSVQGQYGANTYNNTSSSYGNASKPAVSAAAPTSAQPQQPAYGSNSYAATKPPVVVGSYAGSVMGPSAGTTSPPSRGPGPSSVAAGGGSSSGAGHMSAAGTGPGSGTGGPGAPRYYPQGTGGPGTMGPMSVPPGPRAAPMGPMGPIGGGPSGPMHMGRPGPYGGPPPMREDDRARGGGLGPASRRDYDDRGPGSMRGGPPPPLRDFRDRDRDFRDRDRELRDRDGRDRDTRDARDGRDSRDRDRSDRERERQAAPQSRDRDRDRDRDRRPSPAAQHRRDRDEGTRRPQPRSPSPVPVVTARAAPPRRRSPSPPPAAAAPRPKLPEYAVRVPQHCVTTLERDYLELLRRYSHLAVPPDFSRLLCSWVRAQPGPPDSLGISLLPLDRHIRFDHEQDLTRSASVPTRGASEVVAQAHRGVKFVAKVLLVQGLSSSVRQDVLLGPHHEGGAHLANALKFVAARFSRQQSVTGGDERDGKDKDGIGRDKQRGVLGALGGTWDPELDGGNPDSEDGGLIRTCIRHVKEQAGVDLSACVHWLRVCDVTYIRAPQAVGSNADTVPVSSGVPLSVSMSDPSLKEVVVLFAAVPDACVAGPDTWPEEARQQQAFKQQRLVLEAEARKKEDTTSARKEKDSGADKEKSKDEKRDKREEDGGLAAVAEEAKDKEVVHPSKDADKDKEKDSKDKDDGSKVEPESTKDTEVPGATSPPPPHVGVREVPLSEEPGIQLRGRAGAGGLPGVSERIKTFSISLHGLLDYDETDREEPTFELSVFAECFQDFLAREYGGLVYAALVAERDQLACPPAAASVVAVVIPGTADGNPVQVGKKRNREDGDDVEDGRASSEVPEEEKENKKLRTEGDMAASDATGGPSLDKVKDTGALEQAAEQLAAAQASSDAPAADEAPGPEAPAAGETVISEAAAVSADTLAAEDAPGDATTGKIIEAPVEAGEMTEETPPGKASKGKTKGRASSARGRGRGRGARNKGRKGGKQAEEAPEEEQEAEQDAVASAEDTKVESHSPDEAVKVKEEVQIKEDDPGVQADVEMAACMKVEEECVDGGGGAGDRAASSKENAEVAATARDSGPQEPIAEVATGDVPAEASEAVILKTEPALEADMEIDNQEALTPPPPPPPPPAPSPAAPVAVAAAAPTSPVKDSREGSVKPSGPRSSSRDAKDLRDKDRERDKEREQEKERKQRKKYVTDNNLLLAFRFFDRTGCGYIRTDVLRRLLHSLGLGLTHRMVKELVRGGWEEVGPNCRFKGDKLYYRDLTDSEVKEDHIGASTLEDSEPPSLSQPTAAVMGSDANAFQEGTENTLEQK